MIKWKEIERKVIHHSKFRTFVDVKYEMPDGRSSVFTLLPELDTVCVLPITREGRVVLARQYRPGPAQILDELPGGMVEKGEDLQLAAKRELIEETGYKAGQLISLGTTYNSAYSEIRRNSYLALDCEKDSEQELDADEFIEVVLKPMDEFIEQVKAGLSTDIEVAWAGLVAAGVFKKA